MRSGVIPYPESITRLRRKIQEEFPETRGADYYIRKISREMSVRDQIDNFELC